MDAFRYFLTLVISVCVLCSSAFCAQNGRAGTTSTASVRISITIPEKVEVQQNSNDEIVLNNNLDSSNLTITALSDTDKTYSENVANSGSFSSCDSSFSCPVIDQQLIDRASSAIEADRYMTFLIEPN